MSLAALSSYALISRKLTINDLAKESASKILNNPAANSLTCAVTNLFLESGKIKETFKDINKINPVAEETEADLNRLKATKPQIAASFEKQFTPLKIEVGECNTLKGQIENKIDLNKDILRNDIAGILKIIDQAIDNNQDISALHGSQTISNIIAKQKTKNKETKHEVNVFETRSEKIIKKLRAQSNVIRPELGASSGMPTQPFTKPEVS